MPELKPIDGHYQFNGTSYAFYLERQPNLRCETPDCSSCKERSAAYMRERAGEAAARQAELAAEEQKAVEAAADQAARDRRQAQLNAAGQRKHEALRLNGLRMQKRADAARQLAADEISKAEALAAASIGVARKALEEEISAALQEQLAGEREIQAKDWLKMVLDEENAALVAAEAARKAQDEAEKARLAAEAAEASQRAQEAAKAAGEGSQGASPAPVAPQLEAAAGRPADPAGSPAEGAAAQGGEGAPAPAEPERGVEG